MLNLAILAQQHFKDNPGALKGYRQYLALKPRPENADAVAAIVRQLEQEANPAPVSAPMAVPIQSTIAATVKDSKVVHAPTNTSSTPSKPLVLPTNPIAAPPRISNSPTVVAAPSNGVKPAAAAARSPTNGPKEIAQTHVPKEAPATDGVQTAADARYHYKKPAKPVSGNRSEAQRLFGQGEQAHQAHRLPEAVIAYRTATQLDPGFFEAHYNLGLAATEAGNLQVALTAYENALAIVPNSLDARYNFALVLKQAGFLFDAENELEKLLDKYPNEARGHLALANLCAQKLQDLPRARQHYLKVLDIEPQHPQGDAIRHWVADHPL
jgi:tetratricopeptide (TPR) repeat protein